MCGRGCLGFGRGPVDTAHSIFSVGLYRSILWLSKWLSSLGRDDGGGEAVEYARREEDASGSCPRGFPMKSDWLGNGGFG
jgi:hypothetical protein